VTTLALPAEPLTAASDDPPALHLRARLDEQVRALLEHQETAKADTDPEGVHQIRVAVRRLRAALKADDAVHDLPNVEELRVELKWLGGELGPVRDLDVLLGYFRAQAAGFDERELAAVDRLLGTLTADRERARKRMVRALRGRRYAALLVALVVASTAPVRGVPRSKKKQKQQLGGDLTGVVERPFRKLTKLASTLDTDATDEDLHELRIRGKRLRYAAELAVPTGGKPVRQLIKATRGLQDVLGDHQDAVVAEQRVRALLRGRTDAEEIFVAGRLVERERARQAATRNTWQAAFAEVDEAFKVLSG
jgi:CHAD domain-containing protein